MGTQAFGPQNVDSVCIRERVMLYESADCLFPRREEEGRMSSQIAALLSAWGRGGPDARVQFCPLIYDTLRRLVHGCMRRERPGHTLQTTTLVVHEPTLRLIDPPQIDRRNLPQFFDLPRQSMRRIEVDIAPETVMRDWKAAPSWLQREVRRKRLCAA